MDARPPQNGAKYSGAFPETFKDFFSMIEEDCEDLCGNSLLEDKVSSLSFSERLIWAFLEDLCWRYLHRKCLMLISHL